MPSAAPMRSFRDCKVAAVAARRLKMSTYRWAACSRVSVAVLDSELLTRLVIPVIGRAVKVSLWREVLLCPERAKGSAPIHSAISLMPASSELLAKAFGPVDGRTLDGLRSSRLASRGCTNDLTGDGNQVRFGPDADLLPQCLSGLVQFVARGG